LLNRQFRTHYYSSSQHSFLSQRDHDYLWAACYLELAGFERHLGHHHSDGRFYDTYDTDQFADLRHRH
jgi:hypothetical protein